MSEVFVTGASILKVDRYYENNIIDLAIGAISGLAEEISIVHPDILILANAYSESATEQVLLSEKIASSLGLRVPAIRTEQGDASGGSAIFTAYSFLKSGIAKSVLIVGAEKLSDFPTNHLNDILAENLDEEYSYRIGMTQSSYAALQMKLYMKTYGVGYDYFAEWPYQMHKNASENHYAYLKFQVDKDTIMKSQIISDPIRLFDTAARADGAAAILLTNGELARKFSESKVKVENVYGSSFGYSMRELVAVREAWLPWRDFKPNFIEIHDSYSVIAAMILDEIGFERGKSLYNIADSQVNLSGGLKARGYPGGATGVYQLAEAYMQLTGTFKGKRAKNAERGAVVSTDDLGKVAYTIGLSR